MDFSLVNNPRCPQCDHTFAWIGALKQILGPGRRGSALWGALCPECGADLRVPMARVLLIVASGVFFGSQSSTLLVLSALSRVEFYAAQLFLILGFYAIAIFIFLKLELAE